MDLDMNARWLRWCLTAIVVLLAVIAIELSALTGTFSARALADGSSMLEFPNKIEDRQELLRAQDRANRTLDAILQHLKTRTIKVELVSTDKNTRAKTGEKRTGKPAETP